MAVAPEHHRAARLGPPQLHLAAILAFAFVAMAGSVFLAYTSFSHGEVNHNAAAANDVPVYEARAVPFDAPREDPAQRAASIARALTATQAEVYRAEAGETEGEEGAVPAPTRSLLAEANRELKGFNRFPRFAGENNFLAFTTTSFGISAQSLPAGFVAPDAETFTSAPVPEASTWLCGGALLVLVAFRGARASWHRKRRRFHQ